ncbi:ubiquinol-cytochrome C chaperone family protein [Curvivirga aplysinae]|uniref:ubiquinol-cytochrome C chaperone family protein n=1 Tax=Curvivirga aplysinae TaxID=2529852 RepID=UPI0012BC7CEC|nr:ubiquinol-cytochrome C chaperone family protein [Curvivirga aplysinae]MTI09628.1 ubiquinol-cytochrome C chaperone [Curvivirga aplysinae]
MPLSWVLDLFKGAADKGPVGTLYSNIVAQARSVSFYRDLGVADDLDGRFDMIALHYFLAMDRMRQDETLMEISQKLANLVIADMDRSLREMGVGDMKVGKKVQDMGLALYGRMEMYDHALMEEIEDSQKSKLGEAIMRNVYRRNEDISSNAQKIVDYVFSQREYLKLNSTDEIANGHLKFEKIKES